MPSDLLQKTDLVVASRVPGFEDTLRSTSLRLTTSGLAYYWSRTLPPPPGQDAVQRVQHVFEASALQRIRGLLEGLPPAPERPPFLLEDAPTRTFRFWSGEAERSLSFYELYFEEHSRHFYEARYGEPYPAMHRLRALWQLLHFPFERGVE